MNKDQNTIKNNRNYFFCYSKRVSDYLQELGHQYITVAIEPKSQRMFSLYKVTDELQTSLDMYESPKK